MVVQKFNDLTNLCVLSKLNINTNNQSKIIDDINTSVGFINTILDVNTQGHQSLVNLLDVPQRLRSDIVTEINTPSLISKLSQHTTANLYLVPQIVE